VPWSLERPPAQRFSDLFAYIDAGVWLVDRNRGSEVEFTGWRYADCELGQANPSRHLLSSFGSTFEPETIVRSIA
jgi:hypothetical protein